MANHPSGSAYDSISDRTSIRSHTAAKSPPDDFINTRPALHHGNDKSGKSTLPRIKSVPVRTLMHSPLASPLIWLQTLPAVSFFGHNMVVITHRREEYGVIVNIRHVTHEQHKQVTGNYTGSPCDIEMTRRPSPRHHRHGAKVSVISPFFPEGHTANKAGRPNFKPNLKA